MKFFTSAISALTLFTLAVSGQESAPAGPNPGGPGSKVSVSLPLSFSPIPSNPSGTVVPPLNVSVTVTTETTPTNNAPTGITPTIPIPLPSNITNTTIPSPNNTSPAPGGAVSARGGGGGLIALIALVGGAAALL